MATKQANMNAKTGKFLEKVEINIIDMKTEPAEGFSYIGYVEDQHTKYGVLFPLVDSTPKEMAKSLKKYFLNYFGPPLSFSSGCGDSFLSEVLCEVLECWKGDSISFTLSTGAQANRNEEKSKIVAKFILDSLSLMTAESNDESWVDLLPQIMLRLNVARHTSHHENPFSAVFRQTTSAYLVAEQDDLRQDPGNADDSVEANKARSNDVSSGSHLHSPTMKKRSGDVMNILVSPKKMKLSPTKTSGEENDIKVKQEPDFDTSQTKNSEAGVECEANVSIKEEPRDDEEEEDEDEDDLDLTCELTEEELQEKLKEEIEDWAEDDLEGPPMIEMDYAEDEELDDEGLTNEGNPSSNSEEVKKRLDTEDLVFIERLKVQVPNITLSEIRNQLLETKNIDVHISTICRAMKRRERFLTREATRARKVEPFDVPDENEQNQVVMSKKNPTAPIIIIKKPPVKAPVEPPPVKETVNSTPQRMKFTSEDEIHLKMLLNIKPLLSVDEIKQRLHEERGLSVTSYNLTKKIASMPLNELNFEKAKQNLLRRPVSEVSSVELGKLVNRNLLSKRRSYIVKGKSSTPIDMEEVAEEVSPSDLSMLIQRNMHCQRRSYVLNSSANTDEHSTGESISPTSMVAFMDQSDESIDLSRVSDPRDIEIEVTSSKTKGSKLKKVVITGRIAPQIATTETSTSKSPPAIPEGSKALVETTADAVPQYKSAQEVSKGKRKRKEPTIRTGKLLEDDLDYLLNLKWRNPLVTLGEMKHRLYVDRKLDIRKKTIARALKRIAYAQNTGTIDTSDPARVTFSDLTGDLSEEDDEDSDLDLDEGQHQGTGPETAGPSEGTSASSSSLLASQGVSPAAPVKEVEARTKEKEKLFDVIVTNKLTYEDIYFVQRLKQENPRLTLREMKDILLTEKRKDVHLSTISRGLKRMGTPMILYGSSTDELGDPPERVIDLTE